MLLCVRRAKAEVSCPLSRVQFRPLSFGRFGAERKGRPWPRAALLSWDPLGCLDANAAVRGEDTL